MTVFSVWQKNFVCSHGVSNTRQGGCTQGCWEKDFKKETYSERKRKEWDSLTDKQKDSACNAWWL